MVAVGVDVSDGVFVLVEVKEVVAVWERVMVKVGLDVSEGVRVKRDVAVWESVMVKAGEAVWEGVRVKTGVAVREGVWVSMFVKVGAKVCVWAIDICVCVMGPWVWAIAV